MFMEVLQIHVTGTHRHTQTQSCSVGTSELVIPGSAGEMEEYYSGHYDTPTYVGLSILV
jgi:hypothetical protein